MNWHISWIAWSRIKSYTKYLLIGLIWKIKKNNNYVDLILLKLLIRDWFECFQKKRSCKHCSIVWKPFENKNVLIDMKPIWIVKMCLIKSAYDKNNLLFLLLLLLLKHLYSAPRRTERFTKEKEWKIENKNYGNKWVFSCLLNIGTDCDSRR